ncbi:MAG: phosphatase PAP2 family protein [Saprospiraceae bacterium]
MRKYLDHRPTRWVGTFIALMVVLPAVLNAQSNRKNNSPDSTARRVQPYYVNKWIGAGAAAVFTVAGSERIKVLQDKDDISREAIAKLDYSAVPGFDRAALRRNLDKVEKSEGASDRVFQFSAILLPASLMLDKRIRKDWLDIALLYLETQGLASSFYAFSPLGPTSINRYRPRVYYGDLAYEDRSDGNQKNSFFSGHVSTTAIGSFFFAKVMTDYHPEWSAGRKALIYGLATLPPAYVGVQRVRALKHFPSDSVAGLAVGAGIGILVPQVHKWWKNSRENRRSSLSLGGYYEDDAKGATLVLHF